MNNQIYMFFVKSRRNKIYLGSRSYLVKLNGRTNLKPNPKPTQILKQFAFYI